MISVTWYVTDHAQPRAEAVEPGAIGMDIPDDVISWAEGHGLSESEPDVYLLVGAEDEGAKIAAAIEDLDRERAERDA